MLPFGVFLTNSMFSSSPPSCWSLKSLRESRATIAAPKASPRILMIPWPRALSKSIITWLRGVFIDDVHKDGGQHTSLHFDPTFNRYKGQFASHARLLRRLAAWRSAIRAEKVWHLARKPSADRVPDLSRQRLRSLCGWNAVQSQAL